MEVDNQSGPNVLANGALGWHWHPGSVARVVLTVVLWSTRAGEGPGRAQCWKVHQLILPLFPPIAPVPDLCSILTVFSVNSFAAAAAERRRCP